MKKLRPSADAVRHAKTIVDRLNATRLDESDPMQRRIVLDADETSMLALQLEQMRAQMQAEVDRNRQEMEAQPRFFFKDRYAQMLNSQHSQSARQCISEKPPEKFK